MPEQFAQPEQPQVEINAEIVVILAALSARMFSAFFKLTLIVV